MSAVITLSKIVIKLVLALFVVGGLGYLLLLALNWQDEAPSAPAGRAGNPAASAPGARSPAETHRIWRPHPPPEQTA